MAQTLYDLVEAIKDDLADASLIDRATANETLTEDIPETVLLQVYINDGEGASNSRTHITTFGGGIRQKRWTVFVDVYCRQRSHIGEDMAKVTTVTDNVIDKLEEQVGPNLFGVTGIKIFKYTWERVTFVYGDPQVSYAGVRFTLEFKLG